MEEFKGGRGKKAPYSTEMRRIPSPLRLLVDQLSTEYKRLVGNYRDPFEPELIANTITELATSLEMLLEVKREEIDDQVELKEEIQSLKKLAQELDQELNELHIKNGDLNLKVQNLQEELGEEREGRCNWQKTAEQWESIAKNTREVLEPQLEEQAAKAGYWYEQAKLAQEELEKVRLESQSISTNAIALLQEALKLRANSGGAIKEKVKQALALFGFN